MILGDVVHSLDLRLPLGGQWLSMISDIRP
jgi:hypothetical protein